MDNSVKNNTKGYLNYINGLKGIASLFIILGHYLGIYRYSENFGVKINALSKIYKSPFRFMIDESWWLMVFFIISGYLVSRCNINTIRDVALRSVKRFLRFAIPVFFVYIVLLFIYKAVGFHPADTRELFECSWFQSYYGEEYSIKDFIFGFWDILVKWDPKLNGPYWVLRGMFRSSVIIYVCIYIYNLINNTKYEPIFLWFIIVLTIYVTIYSDRTFLCLFGMLIYFVDRYDLTKKWYFYVGLVILGVGCYLSPFTFVSSVCLGVIIYLIPRVSMVEKFLSLRPFTFLGDISWGLYSYHWPIICSVGTLSLLYLSRRTAVAYAYVANFAIILIISFVMAIISKYTLENLEARISKIIAGKLDNLP